MKHSKWKPPIKEAHFVSVSNAIKSDYSRPPTSAARSVQRDDPAWPIGTFLFLLLSVWEFENVRMCTSNELKADLMGSVVVVELSPDQ